MPREITHDARGPKILTEEDIDEENGDIAICMCGLSAEYPFCDGSHQGTADEDRETLYKYEGDDDEGVRHEIAEIVFAED
ncbi:MAG: CDGSH iron-sulfur domain-containing protein [Halodesulfurarchaeum sp.]